MSALEAFILTPHYLLQATLPGLYVRHDLLLLDTPPARSRVRITYKEDYGAIERAVKLGTLRRKP